MDTSRGKDVIRKVGKDSRNPKHTKDVKEGGGGS